MAPGVDRDPVRTTIVGGQPNIRTKRSLPVPEGIERLLQRAATDGRFRRGLLADRLVAARDAHIALTPTESALLASVNEEQLTQLIEQATPPPEPRRSFLQHAAAWVCGVLGGVALAGGCKPKREGPQPATMGMRMDEPPPGPATEGARPDVPPPTRGIQPDVPPPSPGKDAPVTGSRPDIPESRSETDG